MKVTLLLALFILAPYANAEKILCAEEQLEKKASGLRTATIFGIQVYRLDIFSSSNNFSSFPACYEITYLRNFDEDDVDKAWEYQFKESSEFDYGSRKEDINKIKSFFGETSGERKHSFELTKNLTRIFENGVLKGEIPGEDFQEAFLTIWTGKNPPTKELQNDLLKTMKR